MGPRRDDGNLVRLNAFGLNLFRHEPVENDHRVGSMQAMAQHCTQHHRHPRIGAEPAGGEGFVRIQVHHPEGEAVGPEEGVERAQPGDERRRRHRDDEVVAGKRCQLDDAADEEAGKAGGAAQARGLAETARRDAANVDAAPLLAARIALAGVVVGAVAADDRDVVAAF